MRSASWITTWGVRFDIVVFDYFWYEFDREISIKLQPWSTFWKTQSLLLATPRQQNLGGTWAPLFCGLHHTPETLCALTLRALGFPPGACISPLQIKEYSQSCTAEKFKNTEKTNPSTGRGQCHVIEQSLMPGERKFVVGVILWTILANNLGSTTWHQLVTRAARLWHTFRNPDAYDQKCVLGSK